MTTAARILAFVKVGDFIRRHYSGGKLPGEEELHSGLDQVIALAHTRNNWFIPRFTDLALKNIGDYLGDESLEKFAGNLAPVSQKTVAVICAGNVPMVGFHDVMCVLLSGHKALIKPSSDDDVLLPFFLKLLTHYEPGFEGQITFARGMLTAFDAVIATGSNNTASYFHYYFGKYPNIIRKNRSSVAILRGNEDKATLKLLGDDIFTYFGLGCRNVSKVLVPKGYSFDRFFESIVDFGFVVDHNKYGNNYDYNRVTYLMGGHKFLDNNFLIVKQDEALHAPVAVLFFEEYDTPADAEAWVASHHDEIQCVVDEGRVPFGYSQRPVITDFADHIDTLSFLVNL